MDWRGLLRILQDCVPESTVTTYGNLSEYVYNGVRTNSQSISSMLSAAAERGHAIFTNRVVYENGKIVNLNDARVQLIEEGIPLRPNGNVDFSRCPPVNIIECKATNSQSDIEDQDDQTSHVEVEIIDEPTNEFNVSDRILEKWQHLHFPKMPPEESFTWTGFDSAWAGNNPGAIAWMTGNQSGLVFENVKSATFDECIDHVNNISTNMHLLMIDQPTIVCNTTGGRPVERAVSHEIGRALGGVQLTKTSNETMFGPNAPIWRFLKKLTIKNFKESTAKSVMAQKGHYYLETFPALGNLGLFGWKHCPKYNPDNRKTFDIKHWQGLCKAIRKFGEILNIDGCLISWATTMQDSKNPTKAAQDKADAILCMLFGYIWWRSGLEHSVVIGDNKTGYMVVPCFREGLRTTLRNDAKGDGVPVDELFPKELNVSSDVDRAKVTLSTRIEEIKRNEVLQKLHIDCECSDVIGDNKTSHIVTPRIPDSQVILKKDGVEPEGKVGERKDGFIAWLIRILQRFQDRK